MFDFLAKPLGYLMWLVYEYIGFHNYFLTIFLFTLIVRILMFPLSLKSQKSQVERAKLAPRLERLQKKYAKDPQKLQQKQQELYQKEGVSMMGGCLPSLVQIVLLFGIIAVIYSPLTTMVRIPDNVVAAAVAGVQAPKDESGNEITQAGKVSSQDLTGYYQQMRMLNALEANQADVLAQLQTIEGVDAVQAQAYFDEMIAVRDDFTIFGVSLLENPWQGWTPNWLWIIGILSGATALLSSFISMRIMKAGGGDPAQAQAQGCTNVMMYGMPLFSLIVTFTVPGGVGVYWICSNAIAIVQTIVLNKMYNPAKARAQAEAEYEERRRKKAEDKKRLAEARQKEIEDQKRLQAEEAAAKEQARLEAAANNKKPVQATKNPNKLKKKEAAQGKGTAEPTAPPATGEEIKRDVLSPVEPPAPVELPAEPTMTKEPETQKTEASAGEQG